MFNKAFHIVFTKGTATYDVQYLYFRYEGFNNSLNENSGKALSDMCFDSIKKQLKKLALSTVEAVGLGFAGIDCR